MTESRAPADALVGLDSNVVIAASAGTGKTHALTNIFIGHALGLGAAGREVPVERIAATTFSRAAAGEIRERLEMRLGAISERGADALDRALLQRVRDRGLAEQELQRRAARCLDALARATIDTLHGVAAQLLRRHAFRLGLTPDFTILEEQQAFEDAERTVDDVLSQELEAGGERTQSAERLIDACGGLERARSELILLLGRMDEEGITPESLAPADDDPEIERLLDELGSVADLVAADDPSEATEPARAVLDSIRAGRTGQPEFREAVTALLGVRATPRIKRLAAWPRLDGLLARLGSSSAGKKASIAAFTGLLAHREQVSVDARGFSAIIAEVGQRLHAARRANHAFAFSDLLRVARDMLRDHTEIALAARAQVEALLVDEFQDTSRVQRDLILLLRERPESIRARQPGTLPHAEDLDHWGLLIVGDRKQSIYGFRGADVSVFTSLTAELAGEHAAAALDLQGVSRARDPVAAFTSLKDNRRSRSAILTAVNAVSQQDFSGNRNLPYEIRYTDAERLQLPDDAAEADPGRVTVVLDDGAIPELTVPIVASAEGALRAAFVAAGAAARSNRAGTAWRDIAVLARRRSTLPLVELALGRLGIPFVVAGRALYRTPEVTDLFAALRLAVDPRDRRALATVARGPLGGLSDATLAALCEPGRGLMPARRWNEVELHDAAEALLAARLAAHLDEWVSIARHLSPRDAVAFSVTHFELEALYAALPHGQVRFGNIGRLLEIAARHGGSLPAFVRWIARQIELDVDEAEAAVFSNEDDAVRLLTIHASKGLAFQHVVLVDLDASERPQVRVLALHAPASEQHELVVRHRSPEGPIWTPSLRRAGDDALGRARAERQRLSYVALTRAQRELTLVLPVQPVRGDCLAATLTALIDDGTLTAIDGVKTVTAAELLAEPEVEPAPTPVHPSSPPQRPATVGATALAVGATALADFHGCPRRFRLLHVEGISEPERGPRGEETEDDPRSLGSAAHRVLEGWPLERWGTPIAVEEARTALEHEGLTPGAPATERTADGIARFLSSPFAARVRTAKRVHRELAWVTPLAEVTRSVPTAISGARARRTSPAQLDLFAPPQLRPAPPRYGPLLLKTTFDLLVVHADGSVDVIDYKRTRGGDADRYRFQLAAYALVVRRAFSTERVRAGLVHLLADDPEPEWLDVADDENAPRSIAELAAARWRDAWPPVARPQCQRLRCGFIDACHR